jgi:hypothetical protein
MLVLPAGYGCWVVGASLSSLSGARPLPAAPDVPAAPATTGGKVLPTLSDWYEGIRGQVDSKLFETAPRNQ